MRWFDFDSLKNYYVSVVQIEFLIVFFFYNFHNT